MTKNYVTDLSGTALSNSDLGGAPILGSSAISSGDNAMRGLAAALAMWRDDLGGIVSAGGTATGVTLTATQSWTAYGTSDGQIKNGTLLAMKMTAAATGAATLNVNGIGTKKIRRQGDSAIQANDWLSGGIYLFRYDTAYDSNNGAWVLLNPAADGLLSNTLPVPVNVGIAASVGSSALTVALKGADGNDPSASNPVYIPFRDVTAGTGTPSYLAITAAMSIVISNGSTVGFTSGAVGRLWLVMFNDGGTARLGLVNCRSGASIMSLRSGIASSTAEGGAGAADSAQVIYTGTAVTSKAMTVLGYLEATEATAGTWATTPSLIKLWQPGDPLPGDVVQIQRNDTGAVATGTTAIPNDDTIPQSGEGDQYMSQAITPTSATNVLNVKALATLANSANTLLQTALFRDATANALATTRMQADASNGIQAIVTDYSLLAATTSATTFKLRAGSSSGTTTFNGSGGNRKYGGVLNSFMEVREIVA